MIGPATGSSRLSQLIGPTARKQAPSPNPTNLHPTPTRITTHSHHHYLHQWPDSRGKESYGRGWTGRGGRSPAIAGPNLDWRPYCWPRSQLALASHAGNRHRPPTHGQVVIKLLAHTKNWTHFNEIPCQLLMSS